MPRFPLLLAALASQLLTLATAEAYTVRGAGTSALIGGDLTDPENNGVDGANTNWNWVSISATSENTWSAEGAYNIFDNKVGAGDDKWCCDGPPQSIAVRFERPYVLTHFTLAAGNDAAERDPTRWYIEGSNDGTNWTVIYGWTAGLSPFSQRLEVLQFNGNGADFATPQPWSWFRYRVETNDNALLQINELELFGVPVQVIQRFETDAPLIYAGEPLTLSWALDPGTTAATITGIGNVMPLTVNGTGSARLDPGPSATTTYTLDAIHPLTTASQALTVTVTNQPIIRNFAATPPIIGPGESAVLNWNVVNATEVRLDGVTVDGTSLPVTPAGNKTYTLSATNPNGTASAETTLSVVIPGVPVISEFMADNDGALVEDADGASSDWIEIHNPSGTAASLGGYFLTDDPADLRKWSFPPTTLASNAYLLVFASGKNRTGPELHTNFSLAASGEYLALIKPDGVTVVSEFGPAGTPYPRQQAGVSFGMRTDVPQPGYFATPSPAAANGTGFEGYVEDTKFSINRGFFSDPFPLAITTATPGASIRYTTDGTWPSESTGTPYSGPITISRTTPVRAIAYKPGHRPTNVDTHTYIFVDDVVTQTAATTQSTWGLPASWGGQAPDYGMDPRVINQHNATIRNDLKTIPTWSIVCNQADLFGASGIYSNPNNSGEAWERGISLEMIDPGATDGSRNFQLNCGLRIQGGAFRSFGLTLKKSFRVLFKGEYGPTKLRFPLFGSTAAQEFDTIIMRMESNDGYQWDNRTDVQYARDQFARQTALDLGIPAPHGRYVHAYINGVYWGVFNIVERPDSAFGASYFGADKDLWDGINFGTATNEGSTVPWNTLQGLVDDITTTISEDARTAAYMKAQGLNPDGTDNPNWADYINVDNFIDYLLVNWYTGNADWPQRNWYNGRERDLLDPAPLTGKRSSTGMHWFVWDSEWTLLLNSTNDKTGDFNGACAPQRWLRNSLEYRVRFADRAHRALFNGGPLTPQPCLDRYAAITRDHRSFIIPELARWGDQHGTLRTLANWENAYNNIRVGYLSVRTPSLLAVLKGAGLYPQTDAPTFSRHGGSVVPTTPVTMATNADRIYYTLDGTDPRLLGGAPHPNALVASFGAGGPTPVTYLNTGHVWKYLADGSDQGTAWRAANFNDSAWPAGPSSLGYGSDGEGEGTTVPSGPAGAFHPTVYFRTTVNIPSPSDFLSFLLRLKYDDEAAVYVNGVEVVRTAGLPANAGHDFYTGTNVASETAWKDFTVPVSRFVPGVNTIAVEVHQGSGNSSDLRMDMFLRGEVSAGGTNVSAPLFFTAPTRLSARSFTTSTGEWSALNHAFFTVDTVDASAANLVISEFHYRPAEPVRPEELAVSADRDDYEFLELLNIGTQTIDLTGVAFTEGIGFSFPDQFLLAPGARAVIVKSADAFAQRYPGMPVAGTFTGNLGNDGERLVLASSRTSTIRDFAYASIPPWPTDAAGNGFSLVLVAPTANPDHAHPYNWRSSTSVHGSPGGGDTTSYAAWKAANSITDDLADPDQDGLNNFGEFAMGSRFDVPDAAMPTARLILYGGAEYLVIDIRRSLAAVDSAVLVVESSAALDTWTADAVPVGETNHGDGTATTTWRSAQPVSLAPQNQLRARFTLR
jgi:hypothetical protein